MKQVGGEASPSRRGVPGAWANKRAAASRARTLASTLHELRAAGFISRRALADELNRRETPTRLGGKWHRNTVARVLARLGLVTNGRINNGLAHKRAADERAKALASTIRELQAKNLVSFRAIARELNEREIPTTQGGHWHPSGVKRLLQRLQRLEASSRTGVTPDEDAEPK